MVRMATKEYKIKILAVTSARNEEKLIGKCIESVLNQTIKPDHYVIVDDVSTDRTSDIIEKYINDDNVVCLKQYEGYHPRFKYFAYNLHRAYTNGINDGSYDLPDWDYLLKIDADCEIPPDYIEHIINKMDDDVGIASGHENGRDTWKGRAYDGARIYRRECWNDIGGLYKVVAWDTHAIINAYYKGWRVRTYPDISYKSHRSSSDRKLERWYLSGVGRYMMGLPLIHTIGVCALRFKNKPYLIGSIVMLAGHMVSMIKKKDKPFTNEYYEFARKFAFDEIRLRLRVRRKTLDFGG